LVPPAGSITGIDANPAMIELFVRTCRQRSMSGLALVGCWPDIAGQVKPHDVAVSHHVAYNVSMIEDYLLSLTARARRRVVLEVTPGHPQAQLNHLWLHFHGIQRPETPTVNELVAVLQQLGLAPQVESTRRPAAPTPQPRNLLVSFTRRRLCLDPTADPEIDRLLPAGFTVPPPEAVCIWWDSDPTAASQPPRPESRDTTSPASGDQHNGGGSPAPALGPVIPAPSAGATHPVASAALGLPHNQRNKILIGRTLTGRHHTMIGTTTTRSISHGEAHVTSYR
jgi:hypothetical protein